MFGGADNRSVPETSDSVFETTLSTASFNSALRLLENVSSRVCQSQAAGRSLEQPHAKLILEFRDAPAGRRYWHVQAPRRFREAVRLDHLGEDYERVEISHGFPKNRKVIPDLTV
jgi:hypothetical protein